MIPTQTCKRLSLVIMVVLSHGLLLRAAQDTARPKLTVAGQIARVDSVVKSFELKSQQEVNNQPTLSDGITLGTKIGQTAPGQRGSLDPIDTSQPKLPANFPRRPTATDRGGDPGPAVRTTVFLTDTTVCKDGKKAILCGELKVNDLVQVTGDEKSGTRGFGVYATEVLRTKQVR
jgi:hypothetical protein